jgi:hypothetical protein
MNDSNRRCSSCSKSDVDVQHRQMSTSPLRWHGDEEIIQLERVEGICRACEEQQTWYEPIDPQPKRTR